MTIIWYMVPEIWSGPDKFFLSSWAIFLPFYPPNSPKNENFKKKTKKKTPGDIIILHRCTKNQDHMLYHSWNMNNPKNQNFKKMKNNAWRYHHFAHVYQKLWLDGVRFLRSHAWCADGEMDEQTDRKSDIGRWVPHLKIKNKKKIILFRIRTPKLIG